MVFRGSGVIKFQNLVKTWDHANAQPAAPIEWLAGWLAGRLAGCLTERKLDDGWLLLAGMEG